MPETYVWGVTLYLDAGDGQPECFLLRFPLKRWTTRTYGPPNKG